MDMLVEVLNHAGFSAKKPQGSFFLYTKAPKAANSANGQHYAFANAEDFSQFLIKELLISTVPWDDAGNFVRFSVTFDAPSKEQEREMIHTIAERLAEFHFEW